MIEIKKHFVGYSRSDALIKTSVWQSTAEGKWLLERCLNKARERDYTSYIGNKVRLNFTLSDQDELLYYLTWGSQ